MRLSSDDFHFHEDKLTKEGTTTISYTDYQNISEDYYRHHFSKEISDLDNVSESEKYDKFLDNSIVALDNMTPERTKYVRSNHSSFTNKNISNTIMVCSRLRNQLLQSRSSKDKAAYNKQRSYCLSLVRKTKKDFFSNLHHKKIADSKCFRKYLKLLFPEKSSSFNRITIVKECNIEKG